MANLILSSDSYKLSHDSMLPEGTTHVYSYFESRRGAAFDKTVFFGLQPILRELMWPVTQYDLDEAIRISTVHFGMPLLNVKGWQHIIDEHDGRLPLRIKAVPEGTPVQVSNVLMTVENTDPEVPWLTNYVESFLTHVWYPSTVASLSYATKQVMARYLFLTTGSTDGLEFMLHDFGYRGAATHDAAAIGGAGHLVNFKGTDTLPAMELALSQYAADLDGLAYSVPASEHSVMTALGEDGEEDVIRSLLEKYPAGILSVVADSYDYYRFVSEYVGSLFYDDIIRRDGVFVVRPDSVTPEHPTPESLVLWTLETLWGHYGGVTNEQGFKVLNPHVRILWGDGIDAAGIERILDEACNHGFAASNLVFGMGGGLLQKVNRDTQRFAFKSSAQKRDGVWHDVFKKPLSLDKASKPGRLSLIPFDGSVTTVAEPDHHDDLLREVFKDGVMLNMSTFDEVRSRAAVSMPSVV